ncbi:MAG: PIN domain-containing protein [Candidatus Omnitrophota bacterium]
MVEDTSSFIIDFARPLQDKDLNLYFDTSLFVNYFSNILGYKRSAHIPYNKACFNFLNKIDFAIKNKKNILCWTSAFTLIELFHFVMNKEYDKSKAKRGIVDDLTFAQYYKKDYTIISDSFPIIDKVKKDLDKFPFFIVESPVDIGDEIKRLVKDYHLLTADAYHIATATSLGIKDIVAVDEDFGRPALKGEFTLYTPIYKLVNPI